MDYDFGHYNDMDYRDIQDYSYGYEGYDDAYYDEYYGGQYYGDEYDYREQ